MPTSHCSLSLMQWTVQLVYPAWRPMQCMVIFVGSKSHSCMRAGYCQVAQVWTGKWLGFPPYSFVLKRTLRQGSGSLSDRPIILWQLFVHLYFASWVAISVNTQPAHQKTGLFLVSSVKPCLIVSSWIKLLPVFLFGSSRHNPSYRI